MTGSSGLKECIQRLGDSRWPQEVGGGVGEVKLPQRTAAPSFGKSGIVPECPGPMVGIL